MKAKTVLRHGYEYRLGNGSSSFWSDPWSTFGRLDDLVWYVDIHDIHLTVADVFHHGTWQLSQLYTQLPVNVLTAISSISVCLSDRVSDGYTWKGNLDGIYSAKAGYSWLTDSNDHVETLSSSTSWKGIWRLPAPEKIKFFMWTACHNSLPTRVLLNHRGMLDSSSCPRCPGSAETILHCLRDCSFSKQLWIFLGFDNINFFSEQDISSWLHNGVACDSVHLFLAACWWLWRARNNLCLANEVATIHQIKLYTYTMATLHAKAFAVQVTGYHMEKWVTWHPEEGSAVILNVDGSSLGNPGQSGFGGVLRFPNGDWIIGFAGSVGISTILHVELLAIYHGLTVAWTHGHRDLICYSDSSLSILLINQEVNLWHHYAAIISNIQDLVKRNWTIRFKHTWREANSVADLLAKQGAAGSNSWTEFLDPPEAAIPLLQTDASRALYARR